jgi:hypothetical protein
MIAPRLLGRTLIVAFAVIGFACSSPSEPRQATLITLSSADFSLDAIGATRSLVATVRDAENRPINFTAVQWTSDAPLFATVSSNGLVTAVANGTAVITATYNGLTATVDVIVDQVAVAPVIVSGNAQSGVVAQPLPDSIRVRVQDRLGTPIVGKFVTFTVTSGGGTVGAVEATSVAGGLVATTWTLGTSTTGLQRVTLGAQGTNATTLVSATAVAGPATVLRIAAGNLANGQTGDVGQPVPIRPAVELFDSFGNGVSGATVNFTVTGGGGSVTGGAALVGANGVATVGSWTLGTSAGVNTLQAAHGALTPVTFTAQGVADRCTAAGATVLTVGVELAASLALTDCVLGTGERYDLYRFDVAVRTSYAIEMSSPDIDAFLSLFALPGGALLAENDDIIRTINTDSRIGITLDPGSYLVRARSFGPNDNGPYTVLVRTALVGVAARMIPIAPDGQVAAPGATVGTAPSVRVVDELDAPVQGVTVNFATVPGVGSATGTSAVTDANGLAAVGSWTLAAGANVLSATTNAAGTVVGDPVVFNAKGNAGSAGFDINLRFVAMPTASQLQTFSNAATRWETIITGDITNQASGAVDVGDCSNPRAINETIDDVIIIVRLEAIDGPGQVLGQAGPCLIRSAPSSLPALGVMDFDIADIPNLENQGRFGDVILHEMGHVLGIGTIWDIKGFLENPSPDEGPGPDTHFDGPFAIAAFNAIGGTPYSGGAKVPVENTEPGGGTRNSHWRESILDRELMTGLYDGNVANPLSILTVQSLRDLGYVVDNGAADPITIVTSIMSAEGPPAAPQILLKDDIRRGPIFVVDRYGRRTGATLRDDSSGTKVPSSTTPSRKR